MIDESHTPLPELIPRDPRDRCEGHTELARTVRQHRDRLITIAGERGDGGLIASLDARVDVMKLKQDNHDARLGATERAIAKGQMITVVLGIVLGALMGLVTRALGG